MLLSGRFERPFFYVRHMLLRWSNSDSIGAARVWPFAQRDDESAHLQDY